MTPDPTDAELDENIDRLKKRLNYGKDEADLDQLGALLEADEALRACRRQSKAGAEAVRFEVIKAAYRPGPRCRDCADHDGRCPNSGELCDPYEAALECLRQSKTKDALLAEIREHCKSTKGVFQGMKAIRATLAAAPEPPG